MKMSLSVIIPVYNVENYIQECVNNLIHQTLKNVELIFIDDCSTDNSFYQLEETLRKNGTLEQQIVLKKLDQNIGSAAVRNLGLELATGDYICFVDSDDRFEKNMLEDLLVAITRKDADIVWSDFYYEFKDKTIRENQNFEENNIVCIQNMLQEKMHGALWNKIYRKSLFTANEIKFIAGLDMWEDLTINIKLFAKADKVSYLNAAFYYYNQQNNNSISATKLEKTLNERIENTKSIINFLNQKTDSSQFQPYYNTLKLAAKQNLLFSTDLRNFKRWKSIFPESNTSINNHQALPFHLRTIGWFASHAFWFPIQCWIFIKKLK